MDTLKKNTQKKQENPSMRTGETDSPIKITLFVSLFVIFVLCGCGHREAADITSSDSIVCDVVEDEQSDDSLSIDVPPPPEPQWKSDSKNKYRELTDSEIEALSLDSYDKHFSVAELERWKEFVKSYRPFYSKVCCPQCKQKLLAVYSEFPQEDWESLSGRGGYFIICTHCKKIDDFEIVVMN